MAKFQIGDRLRVIRDTDVFSAGDEVVVDYVEGRYPGVETIYQMTDGWWVYESDLELINETSDDNAEYEYAVFYPRVHDGVHRGPFRGEGARDEAYGWVAEAYEDGFRTDAFVLKRRPINDWEVDR